MAVAVWEKSYPPGVRWRFAPQPQSLVDVFDAGVKTYADKPFLDFLGKRYTFRGIEGLVNRAAKGFQQIGVGPGVHVGLFLPNTPHYPIAFFGVLKAGGVVVNYSPLDAAREIAFKIDNSETDIIVTLDLEALYPKIAGQFGKTRLKKIVVGGLTEVLPFPKNLLFPLLKRKELAKVPQDERHVRFAGLIANDGRYRPHPVKDPAGDMAVLAYTGGTTGQPKGAMLTHGNLTAALQMYGEFNGGEDPLLRPGQERILAVLPLFHIFALTVILLLGVRDGQELILHPRFDLEALLKDIHTKKPTVLAGVPTIFAAIINHPGVGKIDFSSLRMCVSGGAPLPPDVQEKFEKVTGCRLGEGWGMTETAPAGTASHARGQRKRGSCGLPLPGLTMEVVDVDDPLKVLPIGQTGEICVTGANVMKGYWKNPDATAEAFAGGRFHTGDVGYIDQDGFVFLVDRKKDMILCSGYNVYPRNVEDAIYQHPAVSEVTVVGIPDDYRGESPKAFIKLKPGAKRFTLEELQAFLADKLGKHEQPTEIEFRDALPKSIIGKLLKKELVEEERKKYQARKAAQAS
jgi:long-chain acyl-CoA synthetase